MAASSKSCFGNVIGNFISNLDLVVRQLEEGDSFRAENGGFNKSVFWSKLLKTVKLVSDEVTKLSMMFSKPPLPSVENCEPLIARVEAATLTMVSTFYGLPKSQGLRLRRILNNAVLGVVRSIKSFALTLKDDTVGSPDQLKATGCVWQHTDSFKSLPTDNFEVALRVIKDTSGLVRDAAEELQEAVENGVNDDMGDISDDIIENTGDNSGSWSDNDKSVVKACVGLVKVVKSALKKTSEAVKRNGQCDDDAKVAQLDDLADYIDRISPLVDDLVSVLYPPLRSDLTEGNVEKLVEHLKTFLLFLRQSHLTDEEDAQWVDFLLTASQHNLDKITTAIKDG